jgi:outer membrane protein assembly factor BamB
MFKSHSKGHKSGLKKVLLVIIFFSLILLLSSSVSAANNSTTQNKISITDNGSLADSPWARANHDNRNTAQSPFQGPQTSHIKLNIKLTAGSAPSIATDGTFYVGNYLDKNLYAFNPDGTIKWKFRSKSPIWESPAIGNDGSIYFSSDIFYALDKEGKLKWTLPNGGATSPVLGNDGTIYDISFNQIFALNNNGSIKWFGTFSSNTVGCPALGLDGSIYLGCIDGIFYAINTDGSLKWKYETGSKINTTPAIGLDGSIYFGDANGILYAINTDGSLKWKYKTGSAIKIIPGPSPVIGLDGSIYFGDANGILYAINTDGSLKWKYKSGSAINFTPCIDKNSTIFFGSDKLYAINKDGILKWKIDAIANASPSIDKNGTLYMCCSFGLIAIHDVNPSYVNVYVNGATGNDIWDGLSPQWNGNNGPKKTIQSGINVVKSGKSVYVSPGTYKENISINKNLKLVGVSPNNTVLDGNYENSVVVVFLNNNVLLSNLKIQNSSSNGNGILDNGNLTINHCIITKNKGIGISTLYGPILITNSIISNNNGGILNAAKCVIKNSYITGNISNSRNGGGIYNVKNLQLYDCTISDNLSPKDGGGIYTEDRINYFYNCIITRNKSKRGGGVFVEEGVTSLINCSITNNSAQSGAGFYNKGFNNIITANLDIKNCNISSNTAIETGGGISAAGGYIKITGSTIMNNKAKFGSITYQEKIQTSIPCFRINYCRIFNNAADPFHLNDNAIDMDVRYNWWGCNDSPVKQKKVLTTPWLYMTLKTGQNIIEEGKTIDITANFNNLYDGHSIKPLNPITGHISNGILVNFTTTISTIKSPINLLNGLATTIFKAGSIGVAKISAKMDNQTVSTSLTIVNTPQIKNTTPANNQTGISKTNNILIKFIENIRASSKWNYIKIKNLSINKYVTINKSISLNTLTLKTSTRTKYTWYQVTIPAAAVRNQIGNNLISDYTFKFRTGA